ncbi:lambda family phage tail tape measure protein [Xanthomonas arboricola]|nr:lambda family phage tail tape measure protein [Xanthomonas arboricola]
MRLSSKGSSKPGRWVTDRNPPLREPMDAMSARSSVHQLVAMFPIQFGKSQLATNAIAYWMDYAPAPIMYALPGEASMNKWIAQKLNPMIEVCPAVRRALSSTASRDSANQRTFKDFAGGQLYVEHMGSPQRLKSTTVKYLGVDEIDEAPQQLITGDDPVKMLDGRTSAFPTTYKRLYISPPGIAGLSRIAKLYEKSDQRRFHVPCPHCGHYQALSWSGLVWSPDAKHAWYACSNCGTAIEEHNKTDMIARVGAGDREFEIQQRLNGVYREQAQRLTELALQKNTGRIDEATAAAEEAAVRDATERRVQVIRDGYVRMSEAQADWGNGASAAWDNYVAEARNAAGQVESVIGSALGGMEDVFVKFVTTGKLSFSDLANSIIADLARIAAKQAITGLLGSMFGQPGAGTVQREAIPLQGWDTGGYTGPGGKFEPAGIVHKGEGVLSQLDIAAIGGPRGFLSLLSTIRRGRGYAAGGLVGSTAVPAAGRRGNVSVEIQNFSGQPATQERQTQRMPNGEELERIFVRIGARNIAEGGEMAGAIESRFETRRRR